MDPDVLRLEIRPPREDSWRDKVLHVLVNGKDLASLIKSVEAPFAAAEGNPNIAGDYDGLPTSEIGSARHHYLGSPQPVLDYAEMTVLLGCTCGIVDCWPLLAKVAVDSQTVTWSEFRQPHRMSDSTAGEWLYDDFGPFVFDRRKYEEELIKADRELGLV